MNIYEPQTIKLTYAAACEAIAQAFNGWDPEGEPVSELSRAILARLGFRS